MKACTFSGFRPPDKGRVLRNLESGIENRFCVHKSTSAYQEQQSFAEHRPLVDPAPRFGNQIRRIGNLPSLTRRPLDSKKKRRAIADTSRLGSSDGVSRSHRES
jgi:hypothetical protein